MRLGIIKQYAETVPLSEQCYAEMPARNGEFWDCAARYARSGQDESFASEMAYMMVTLYRTSA